MLTIYHNPRCSKSRETLNIIQESGTEVEIIEYLNHVPTKSELKDILSILKVSAAEIIRKGEPIYKELFKGKELTEDQWIEAMVAHPKLIERPIVVKGDRAILGRPPQNVIALI
jgi:arsenate reductase